MAETKDRRQQDLFDHRRVGTWVPPTELPDLSGHSEVWLDPENDGRGRMHAQPCGLAVATRDREWYLPFGHLDGGNLDPDKVKEWAHRELRGKRVINIATGLDAQTLLNGGIDLEAQGCSLHDIAHTAALLDENRYSGLNLDSLGHEYAGRGKAPLEIKPQDIHRAHSSMVGPYAECDVGLARDVDLAQRPLSEKDDLGRVEALEDELIWANNHMEREAALIDVPKLEAWRREATDEMSSIAMAIWGVTGVKLHPDQAASWHELFDALKLRKPAYSKSKESRSKYGCFMVDVPEGYTDEFLKGVDDHWVKGGLRMRRLKSLKSKYLDKYWEAMDDGGRLGFSLYQLRASEDDYGTVVGRYSSANVNIQQVFKVENQERRFGPGFIIRELFIPEPGYNMFSADGSQLQFRLFAHYSNDAELIRRYNEDPEVDFHDLVAKMFGIGRQAAKHNNFAKVLGMGNEKLANRLGMGCTCPIDWRAAKAKKAWFGDNKNHGQSCPARVSNDMAREYERQFPAAKETMQAVSDIAERRGYIRTLLGRRRRFKDEAGQVINTKFYSGFAALLQGSEADIVKSKINTLYRELKTIGLRRLRFPVHDEVVGDIVPGDKPRALLNECLAEVEIKLKVPMIWNSGFGPNWKECH